MAVPLCPRCGKFVFLDWLECASCGAALGYHHPSLSFALADAAGTELDGVRWFECGNRVWGCNWLVAETDESGRCFSCRLTRRQPPLSDTVAWERLAEAGVAKRRLLIQVLDLGLPITPYYVAEGGLGFDLISSLSSNERVMIGHANGIITIDLAETLAERREALRVKLGEPYRTMLGHFRHEIGHYFQNVLVRGDAAWDECRAIFGDERASYRDALDRHYKSGAPEGWAESFISEYATMHPWEDFAECFAHYLHITGTLQTASAAGVLLQASRVPGATDHDIEPQWSYAELGIERMLDDWKWLSMVFNRVNRSMGQGDLYPFSLPEPVRRKLAYVHSLVVAARPVEATAASA